MPLTRTLAPTLASATVAAHLVRLVTDHAGSRGLSVERLMAQIGQSPQMLDDAEARLPFLEFSRLCEAAAQKLGDPFFGLHAGEQVKPGHLGILGFALMSCATLGEALERSRRYSGVVVDVYRNELSLCDGECIRYWRSRLGGRASVDRLQDEMRMAVWVTLVRWGTGRSDFAPNWVAFQHAQPADVGEYARVFRCPVRYGAEDSALAFPQALLTLPLPQANAPARRALDALCERLVQRLGKRNEPAWVGAVRSAILASFERGGPELCDVARAVGMDAAELVDLLARCGLSLRSMVNELRRDLALAYVLDPGLSLADIAFLLGFSEQSAFQRAFKRWTGKTPGEYRNATI